MAADIRPLDWLMEAKDAIDLVIEKDVRPSPETLAVLCQLTIALQLELRAHEADDDEHPGRVY